MNDQKNLKSVQANTYFFELSKKYPLSKAEKIRCVNKTKYLLRKSSRQRYRLMAQIIFVGLLTEKTSIQ